MVPHIALDFTYLLQSFRYSLTKFLADAATSKGYPYDSDPYGRPWSRILHGTYRLIVSRQDDRDGWQDETWNAVLADDPEEHVAEEGEALAYLHNPPNLTSGRWDDEERLQDLDKGATLDQWVPLFIADVQKVVNRQKDNDALGEHFRSLLKAVEGWKVPRLCDGSFAINDAPKDAKEVRDAILEKLWAMEPEQTTAGMQNWDRIEWKGTVQQLAWILRELARNGWITAPSHTSNTTKWKAGDINASGFAKAIAPHFKDVNAKTLEQELKAEGNTVPAQDVEGWAIPQRKE